MNTTQSFRLIRSCALANMTVREAFGVFLAVRRGRWEIKTNRDMLAQAHYMRLLAKPK